MKKLGKNVWVAAVLGILVLATVGFGIYHRHYFVVFVFALWCLTEVVLWRFPFAWRTRLKELKRSVLFKRDELVELFEDAEEQSTRELLERIGHTLRDGGLNAYERKWLERLRDLNELRSLTFESQSRSKRRRLRQAFAYYQTKGFSAQLKDGMELRREDCVYEPQDITETATVVADLYWKLYDTCSGKYDELTAPARELFRQLFGQPYEEERSRALVEKLIDSIQRDCGLPYLVLNLLRMGQVKWGRVLAQEMLQGYQSLELDEEVRAAVYWVSEIHWFVNENKEFVGDYEASIRYLYHLCFTNPDRAGFLEIDSRFFPQFDTINELAQEGFLFKEVLVEKLLGLWQTQAFLFDDLFQQVLESLTQTKNKIYDDFDSWIRFWNREKEHFCREYLYVVEGNLCYARGIYDDARVYYEKALQIDPKLRSALLNLLFCYAKLNAQEEHRLLVARLLNDIELLPSVLYVIGDSYFLLGDRTLANHYYDQLKDYDGWERKVDHYKATFCYDNGMHEEALSYAKKAYELNPNDPSVSYQLSLCYNAVGEKDLALDTVKKLGEAPSSPTWLNYYKFTLERDSGRDRDASETLLGIPSEYFQDPEELSEAEDFAKQRKDLVLLRHLRKKET